MRIHLIINYVMFLCRKQLEILKFNRLLQPPCQLRARAMYGVLPWNTMWQHCPFSSTSQSFNVKRLKDDPYLLTSLSLRRLSNSQYVILISISGATLNIFDTSLWHAANMCFLKMSMNFFSSHPLGWLFFIYNKITVTWDISFSWI